MLSRIFLSFHFSSLFTILALFQSILWSLSMWWTALAFLRSRNAKIVKREEKWKERKILESIYIKSNSTFNLDSGFPLDQIWTDLITSMWWTALAFLRSRNANAVHHMDKDHRIDWNNAKIVKREEKWKERKILESIYIKSNSTFNLDSGFPLDQIWTDLITPSLGP